MRDLAKLAQFEKDEISFASQYRKNVDKMYDRLREKEMRNPREPTHNSRNGKFG